jgi:hypothetical protein
MNEKTPIKLTQLLQAREGLVRRATLANMAFAYRLLSDFNERIHRAGLRGLVNIKSPEANGENWSSLTALEGSQARLEEHFSEEDVMDLADAIRYVVGGEIVIDLNFRIEEVGDMFLVPLRDTLRDYGVVIDLPALSRPETTPTSEGESSGPGPIQSNAW